MQEIKRKNDVLMIDNLKLIQLLREQAERAAAKTRKEKTT